ncbi:L-fucose:H+ symporter permease [Sphingomonas melonis]|uniref:FHS family L-fucose permease-like MFS transporter n=1 Tax=Sphingomonas melonis TaxID=152682 RepID=A0A7Y9FSF0_9SPHN|nr:L-fucose:H+ symporter permease [Sphingomonas melonis]NYD92337.1 FHS family L-fucose permease-like MFS transporter [Sphingomonas melonis]
MNPSVAVQDDEATPPASRAALLLTIGLFFLWGMANNLNDILIAHFRAVFTLSDLQSGLVQSAFYLGYFCFAIPGAIVMQRFGYKTAVVQGLVLFGIGALLFWPASLMLSYGFFLLALFVIASGLAFLETAANPMVAALGSAATAERRLNLAQAFNPLGSIAGVTLGATFILADERAGDVAAASAVRLPYLAIALIVFAWAAVFAVTRFPEIATRPSAPETRTPGAYGKLLRTPRYLAGVGTQFLYVGAQVGVWSFLIRYVAVELPSLGTQRAAWLLTLSLALFMAGRFVGAALMARIAGARLMLIFAGIDALLCLVAVAVGGLVGVAALVLSSALMSIMYPTIFVLTLRGLGPLTKPGASLLVMAIIGGAVLTAVMGYVSDVGSIRLAMLVPAACFVGVALFARLHRDTAVTA